MSIELAQIEAYLQAEGIDVLLAPAVAKIAAETELTPALLAEMIERAQAPQHILFPTWSEPVLTPEEARARKAALPGKLIQYAFIGRLLGLVEDVQLDQQIIDQLTPKEPP